MPNRRDGNSGSRSGVLDCLISSNVALPPSESSRHKPSTSILLPTPTHQLIPPTAFPFLVRINIALTALRTARRIPTFPDLLTPDFSPGPGVADGGLKQCPRLSISKIPIPVTYGQAKALHQPTGPSRGFFHLPSRSCRLLCSEVLARFFNARPPYPVHRMVTPLSLLRITCKTCVEDPEPISAFPVCSIGSHLVATGCGGTYLHVTPSVCLHHTP